MILFTKNESQTTAPVAPAEVGEQIVVISGVKASVGDDDDSDVGFRSAAVPDQVVVGVLQSRRRERTSCDPLQTLYCILSDEDDSMRVVCCVLCHITTIIFTKALHV